MNKVNFLGKSSLMCAAENGNDKQLNMLIKAGADVNKANNKGVTALMAAVDRGTTILSMPPYVIK